MEHTLAVLEDSQEAHTETNALWYHTHRITIDASMFNSTMLRNARHHVYYTLPYQTDYRTVQNIDALCYYAAKMFDHTVDVDIYHTCVVFTIEEMSHLEVELIKDAFKKHVLPYSNEFDYLRSCLASRSAQCNHNCDITIDHAIDIKDRARLAKLMELPCEKKITEMSVESTALRIRLCEIDIKHALSIAAVAFRENISVFREMLDAYHNINGKLPLEFPLKIDNVEFVKEIATHDRGVNLTLWFMKNTDVKILYQLKNIVYESVFLQGLYAAIAADNAMIFDAYQKMGIKIGYKKYIGLHAALNTLAKKYGPTSNYVLRICIKIDQYQIPAYIRTEIVNVKFMNSLLA